MKAAIVEAAGQAPVFGDFAAPQAGAGQVALRVTAAAISHVTRSRASGAHYSTPVGGQRFVPGVDGVGVTPDGQRVYFMLPQAPFGAMAEASVVDARQVIALPRELSDEAAAAMAIPGMSSWAALMERAAFQAGETVLVNGATGASGRLAIQVAKHLGAGKIVATGRNTAALADAKRLGADVTIALSDDADAMEAVFKREFRDGVDVVLDYLWGLSAQTLIVAAAKAGPDGVPIRFVQIGAVSGGSIELPSAALRSSSLQLMGSGIGSVAPARLLAAIRGVLEAAPAAGFEIATKAVPLADVAAAWARKDANTRIVLKP